MLESPNTPRFRVLAVEPDAERADNLKRLIEQRLHAEVLVAGCSAEAIAALSVRVPDVLLASTLLTPQDDLRLIDHIKQLDTARQLAVLTVAPIIDLDSAKEPRDERRGFFWRRIRPSPFVDCEAVLARIEEALERSRRESHVPNIRLLKGKASETAGDLPRPHMIERVHVARRIRRQRARRWTRAELPWLSTALTATGVELQVVNISKSGVLVESSTKFEPNSSTELRLCGSQTSLQVPVRFVRSEIANVDVRGVRYELAAVFQRKLDVVPDRSGSSPREFATPKALAELLVKATGELGGDRVPGAARTIFEQGVRRLVSAREIRIIDRPAPAADGTDAVYFTIPTVDASPAVLQATFDGDEVPGRDEFALLKAAAAAAAIVLQYDGSSAVPASTRRLLPASGETASR